MFEVFDYRHGEPFAFFTYESSAKLFVSWLNKTRGGHADYDKHEHVTSTEQVTGPTKSGALFVTESCACGVTLRTYVDSVL